MAEQQHPQQQELFGDRQETAGSGPAGEGAVVCWILRSRPKGKPTPTQGRERAKPRSASILSSMKRMAVTLIRVDRLNLSIWKVGRAELPDPTGTSCSPQPPPGHKPAGSGSPSKQAT